MGSEMCIRDRVGRLKLAGDVSRMTNKDRFCDAFVDDHLDGTQDALGARDFSAHRSRWHPTIANAKEGAQVAVTYRVEDNPLAVLMMIDALARLKLNFCFHDPTSRDPKVEQASGFAAVTKQDFLRVLVRLSPQDAPEVELALAMRCGA